MVRVLVFMVMVASAGLMSAQDSVQGADSGQGGDGADSRKVNIASDSAVYGAGGGDVVFAGNVLATIGVWQLSAATLEVRGGEYFAFGSPLRASGVTDGGGSVVVNAGYLKYDGVGKVLLRGDGDDPVQAGWLDADDGDITVRALTITYDLDSGAALLSGDALLGRGAEQITGSRISVNVNTGAMTAEQGRVRAVLDAGQ